MNQISKSLPRYKLISESGMKSANSKEEASNLRAFLSMLGEKVSVFTLIQKEGCFGQYLEVDWVGA